MLLIFPPLAKACEPPAGISRLAGFLSSHGQSATLLDANIEGQLHLLKNTPPAQDTWSKRAFRNLDLNLEKLRNNDLYKHQDKYQRVVNDLNRVLEKTNWPDIKLSLANYNEKTLSQLKSKDLLKAAEYPEHNIFYKYFSTRFAEFLTQNPPPLIGFSLNYLSQALTTFAMVGYLKRNYPEIPIIVGGGLVTSWLKNPSWQNPFTDLIDHMVAGAGEDHLLEILNRYTIPADKADNSNPTKELVNFSKSAQSTAKQISSSNRHKLLNLPTPLPDYQGLPLSDYLSPGLILPYAASSGCYWLKCSFCPEKSERNPYKNISPEIVLGQIAALKSKTEPTLLHFLDNAISPTLMQALIEKPPGINWYSFARVGSELADPNFCLSLRKSGCIMLKLGLESGDQAVLDAMHKGIDLSMVAKVLDNLKQAGIATYVYLLFGTPPESIIEARRTLNFTVKHSQAITFLNLAIFNMPISSKEATIYQAKDFYDADLSLYTDFEHPLGWSRRKIRHFLDREFKRHPAIAPIIHRDPPFFSSNHAPFFDFFQQTS